MDATDRYSHYDLAYYIGNDVPERISYQNHVLRPGDMGAALLYAFGATSYAELRPLLGIPRDNPRYIPEASPSGLDYALELGTTIAVTKYRRPSHVLEVGCGRGELAAAFWDLRIPYVGLEISKVAFQIALETRSKWTSPKLRPDERVMRGGKPPTAVHWLDCHCDNLLLQEGLGQFVGGLSLDSGFPFDTVMFVESIEHIPQAEFAVAWPILLHLLRRTAGRLIITNWIDNHPIQPDGTGWDHVRLVDDAFYDSLAKDAKCTVFRQGSHLVLEF